MLNRDSIAIRGIITSVLRGPDGRIKDRSVDKNIVTNVGRAAIIDRLQGNTPAVPSYLGIGTSNTAAAANQTTMVAEVARALGTLSQPDAYTDRLVYNFPAGTGTGTIVEVARFNAAAAGDMYGRGIISPKIKEAGDTLEITYDFTYAAG